MSCLPHTVNHSCSWKQVNPHAFRNSFMVTILVNISVAKNYVLYQLSHVVGLVLCDNWFYKKLSYEDDILLLGCRRIRLIYDFKWLQMGELLQPRPR